ncbi:MAG: DNA alkylation repair protein [Flavobacteriales bacterium]|nr:DNA alkylation repair protein [Flavobacteriales bacterium]
MNAPEYLHDLEQAFRKAEDPERAEQMTAYTRGQYEYYGIMAKPRTDMIRAHVRDHGLPADPVEVVELCWERPQREWQYVGMELSE